MDGLLKNNAKTDTPYNWSGSKNLKGEAGKHGIWEWKFNASGVQQRLFGIFGTEKKHAIFLIGCNHKQNIYQPPDCIDTAITRAKEVRDTKKKVILNERKVRTDI